MRTGSWSIPSADDGALTWVTMSARDGMTHDVAAVPRPGPTATDTAATLAAALAVIEAAHAGEIERLTGIHGAEIARQTEALTRSERRVDLLIARMDGLHDALMAVKAKLTAAEQGRADAVAVAERTMAQLAEAEQRAREAKQRASDVEHRLTDAEDGRRIAQKRVGELEREQAARQGRGLLARLRAACRGE
jgi:chromosome segregation ATPase